MNANKQIKVNLVKEITEKLNNSQAIVVADYSGLTVKEFQMLRKSLKEKDVELKVYKNRLFKLAAKEAGIGEIETSLTGANVFAFGMSDDISPAKILAAFAKDHDSLELKAGTFEGKVIDANAVHEVATLPSFEEALTMLATQLLSPVKYVGVGLNQLVEDGHLENGATAKEESKSEKTPAEASPVETTEAPTEEVKTEEVKEESAVAEEKEGEKNG